MVILLLLDLVVLLGQNFVFLVDFLLQGMVLRNGAMNLVALADPLSIELLSTLLEEIEGFTIFSIMKSVSKVKKELTMNGTASLSADQPSPQRPEW